MYSVWKKILRDIDFFTELEEISQVLVRLSEQRLCGVLEKVLNLKSINLALRFTISPPTV